MATNSTTAKLHNQQVLYRYPDTRLTEPTIQAEGPLTLLSQDQAIEFDEQLFKLYPVEVLMELAGLAVAEAVYTVLLGG